MNTKTLNILALSGSALIFIATFLEVSVNGLYGISVMTAGGIWYLLPVCGLAGGVVSAMALSGKMEIKIAALIISALVLVMSIWFGIKAMDALNQIVAMRSDMANGFESSFFTGKQQDTSNLPKSSFGMGFYCYLIGSVLMLIAGLMTKPKAVTQNSN